MLWLCGQLIFVWISIHGSSIFIESIFILHRRHHSFDSFSINIRIGMRSCVRMWMGAHSMSEMRPIQCKSSFVMIHLWIIHYSPAYQSYRFISFAMECLFTQLILLLVLLLLLLFIESAHTKYMQTTLLNTQSTQTHTQMCVYFCVVVVVVVVAFSACAYVNIYLRSRSHFRNVNFVK